MTRWISIILLALTLANPLFAELTRFEITAREDFAEGSEFGEVGAYERIIGKVYYELDPDAESNATVVDLDLAPRNDRGWVELSADLFILSPKDPSKGNGALLYDVNNRGNKLALGNFCRGARSNDPKSGEHAGDGFLLREGFTIVWSGWDGELLPGGDRLRLFPPLASESEEPITGLVRCEIVPNSATKRIVINWANHGSYRPTQKGP